MDCERASFELPAHTGSGGGRDHRRIRAEIDAVFGFTLIDHPLERDTRVEQTHGQAVGAEIEITAGSLEGVVHGDDVGAARQRLGGGPQT